MAEHSATLDCAMDGGLSAGSEGGLRAALHDVHMPRLNPDEKCRQNPRVIHSASQLACARLRAADRGDVGHAARRHRQRRRRRARDGVNDPPIAHRGTLRVRGMGSFTPSLVLYSRRCSPCRAAQTAARTRRYREPVARSRNGLRLDGRLRSTPEAVTRTFWRAADERGRPDCARSSPGLSRRLRPTRRQPGRRDASIVVRAGGIRIGPRAVQVCLSARPTTWRK